MNKDNNKLTIADIAPKWLTDAVASLKDHDPDCECSECVALYDIIHNED